jgi:hypothetical protein
MLYDSDTPTEFILLLLRKAKTCAKVKDQEGSLPLHTFINEKHHDVWTHDEESAILTTLLDANPEAIHTLSAELRGMARRHVLEILVERYPQAITEKDANGFLPIHNAITNPDMNVETLDFLYLRCPKILTQTFRKGDSVLHLAFSSKDCTENTMEWLIKTWCVWKSFS